MLKQRTIFLFWLPLAISWLLMTFENPWVQAVIGRLPDTQLQLAAFGLLITLMILVESPVIMFLGTGAALSRHRQAYNLLWRYVMVINVFVTIVALLMGFTPLLDWWLGTVVGVPQNIIDAVRPGVRVMALWPAFVGYRRFHQGVMIRNNHTSPIGIGTLIRLLASAATAITVGAITDLPGAAVGAWAMMVSASVELIYVIIVSQVDVQSVLDVARKNDEPPLTYLGAFKFHAPLAMTSIITLLISPVIERGIASSASPVEGLAAWAIIFGILMLLRSSGIAWQEAVISLSEDEGAVHALRRYTWTLGIGLTAALAILLYTPIIDWYMGTVLEVPENLQHMVTLGVQAGLFIPLMTTLQSYLRGLLMRSDTTAPIYGSMMLSFCLTALFMWLGVRFTGLEGVVVGATALSLGYIGEIVLLWRSLGRREKQLKLAYAQATGD